MNLSKLLTTVACLLLTVVCQAAQTGRITANNLNMRTAPSKAAASLGMLPKGTRVEIIGHVGEWYQIAHQLPSRNIIGYIPSVLLKNGKVVLDTSVRHSPNAQSAEVAKLRHDDIVTVLGTSGNWSQISLRNTSSQSVYVHQDYVKLESSKKLPPNTPLPITSTATQAVAAPAPPVSGIHRKYGVLIYDVAHRRELWSQNADRIVPIASLTKMMTLLLALEKLNATPSLSLDSDIPISRAAAAAEPTKANLVAGQTVKLGELLSVMILISCNDCAAVAGEFIGGSTAGFAQKANAKALQLGMTQTTFYNANGLPGATADKDNTSTPNDMLKLVRELWKYPLAREWVNRQTVKMSSGIAHPTTFKGHTPLLGKYGIDGVKTGYTRRAGSCVTTHAKNASGEFFIILLGCESSGTRNTLLEKLMKWLTSRRS